MNNENLRYQNAVNTYAEIIKSFSRSHHLHTSLSVNEKRSGIDDRLKKKTEWVNDVFILLYESQ